MGKSYRFDPDGEDGFVDRAAMKRARRLEKTNRRAQQQEQEQLPAEDDDEAPFNVMSTIDPSWAD